MIFYPLKKAIMSLSMNKRKKQHPFDIAYSDNYQIPEDAGSEHNNSQYFCFHSQNSKESFFIRLALRGGNYPNEVWFTYRDKNGTVFVSDKDHFPKNETPPVSIRVIEAGKKLEFAYNGKMKRARVDETGEVDLYAPGELLDANLSAVFVATSDPFEFSRHMSTEPVARVMAKEKWNKSFFNALQENHQVHYEQIGRIDGTLTIGNETYTFSDTHAFRDHSYGKRDWDYFDRYVWIFGLLENGDTIQCNWVRYPAVTELQTGFYTTADNNTVCLKKATRLNDLPLYENKCPLAVSATLTFEDGRVLTLTTKREISVPYQFQTFRVNEGVSVFDINGLKGRGITEFSFNADVNRWTR